MNEDRSGGGGKLILIQEYAAKMRDRTAVLRGRVLEPATSLSRSAAAEEVLQELDTAHEELMVADEELRRQSEEIERIRQGVAVELRRFRDLFDHAPDGYAETDAHGVVRLANRTLAAQLNILPQFLEHKPLINFVARGDCDRFRASLARLGEGRSVEDASVRLRPRHGGAPFFVDVHAVPVVSPARRVIGARWALRTVASVDPGSPLSIASVTALVKALVAQASAPAACKRARLSVEVDGGISVEPETAAQWFPILAAVLRAELAAAEAGAELPIRASNAGAAIAWRIGEARLTLPTPRG